MALPSTSPDGVKPVESASRCRSSDQSLRPSCGDVGRLALAVGERAAGQPARIDDSAEKVAGRVALRAMSRPLDQIAAERLLARRIDGGRVDLRHVEELPEPDGAADREREDERVRRRAPRDRRRRAQEGEQVAHVLLRHAAIGRIGQGRIEMLGRCVETPAMMASANSAALHDPIPSFGSGEMFGG